MYPFDAVLGLPMVFAGATWHPNIRAHSPNENIFVKDYFESMRFTAAYIERFATLEA
jgi:acetylornithine deacetylase/succinyl-diaminopimelate desuccinylase-like protein